MNAFTPVSKDEFWRFIATRPHERFELDGGLIVQQMVGGTHLHARIAARILVAISAQLSASKQVVVSERGVETASSIRFADVVVVPVDDPNDSLTTTRPLTIVEVLSPSSRALDLKTKRDEYLGIASLDAYIVASQSEAAMQVWQRDASGTFPETPVTLEGLDAVIAVRGRGYALSIPLDSIYSGLFTS